MRRRLRKSWNGAWQSYKRRGQKPRTTRGLALRFSTRGNAQLRGIRADSVIIRIARCLQHKETNDDREQRFLGVADGFLVP